MHRRGCLLHFTSRICKNQRLFFSSREICSINARIKLPSRVCGAYWSWRWYSHVKKTSGVYAVLNSSKKSTKPPHTRHPATAGSTSPQSPSYHLTGTQIIIINHSSPSNNCGVWEYRYYHSRCLAIAWTSYYGALRNFCIAKPRFWAQKNTLLIPSTYFSVR